jgi:hypothetical protein
MQTAASLSYVSCTPSRDRIRSDPGLQQPMSRQNAAFDIFCILQSAADIASRAAQIQARNSYLILRHRVPTWRAQPVTHDYSRLDTGSRDVDSTQSKTEEPDVTVGVVSSADTVVGAHTDFNRHTPHAVQALPSPSLPPSRIIEEPSHSSNDTVDEPVINSISHRILFSC